MSCPLLFPPVNTGSVVPPVNTGSVVPPEAALPLSVGTDNPPAVGTAIPAGEHRQFLPAARRKRGRYRQSVQLSDHFLPDFLSILAFFANLRKRFAYFDCFARFSKKFLLQK